MDYHNLEIENGLCCSKSLFSTLNKKYDELLMPLQLCQKSSKKSINIQIPANAFQPHILRKKLPYLFITF